MAIGGCFFPAQFWASSLCRRRQSHFRGGKALCLRQRHLRREKWSSPVNGPGCVTPPRPTRGLLYRRWRRRGELRRSCLAQRRAAGPLAPGALPARWETSPALGLPGTNGTSRRCGPWSPGAAHRRKRPRNCSARQGARGLLPGNIEPGVARRGSHALAPSKAQVTRLRPDPLTISF